MTPDSPAAPAAATSWQRRRRGCAHPSAMLLHKGLAAGAGPPQQAPAGAGLSWPNIKQLGSEDGGTWGGHLLASQAAMMRLT